ncbi:MAG: HIT domain-containing protein [Porticoccaceae bacterium]|nr:HIT domain-containing protein [Porticoccaceae bacterium]
MFDLDKRLRTDTVLVGELALNSVLLARDATYPWVILVPRRSAITEIHQLKAEDRALLMQESCVLAEVMMALYQPDKLNIATLGNQVPQLHMHHVARFKTDPAWPRPVWGAAATTEYQFGALNHRLADLRAALAPHGLGNP